MLETLVLRMTLAMTLGLACVQKAAPAAPSAVLDLTFNAMPRWRHGAMPWPPRPEPFDDKAFILSAGLMSGLRQPFASGNGGNAAWSSLPHEQEAYPDADAMLALSIDPFSIRGGALLIAAAPMSTRAARTLPADMPRHYVSGAFNTYPFSQTYGYFEVTARVPEGAGLWPAFWLLPVDQTWPPEIDIAEILCGDTRRAYFSLHSTDAAWVHTEPHSYNGSTTTDSPPAADDLSRSFHRYAVDWEPRTITFYLDEREIARRSTPADMHKPFYLVVDLAVGGVGSWAGKPDQQTRFPASLAIRSIRVWKRRPQ